MTIAIDYRLPASRHSRRAFSMYRRCIGCFVALIAMLRLVILPHSKQVPHRLTRIIQRSVENFSVLVRAQFDAVRQSFNAFAVDARANNLIRLLEIIRCWLRLAILHQMAAGDCVITRHFISETVKLVCDLRGAWVIDLLRNPRFCFVGIAHGTAVCGIQHRGQIINTALDFVFQNFTLIIPLDVLLQNIVVSGRLCLERGSIFSLFVGPVCYFAIDLCDISSAARLSRSADQKIDGALA